MNTIGFQSLKTTKAILISVAILLVICFAVLFYRLSLPTEAEHASEKPNPAPEAGSQDVVPAPKVEDQDVISAPKGGYRDIIFEALSKETTLDAVNNLPQFNDTAWVQAMLSGGSILVSTSYSYQRLFVPRLNRVRKILQESKDNPKQVVELLKKKLDWSVDKCESAYQEHRNAAEVRYEPTDYGKCMVYGPASVYLLAEMHEYKALPAMARIYASASRIPVNRIFLFYAMDLLAKDAPREKLPKKALAEWQKYLEVAKKLPAPETMTVPTWNAKHDENDWRITILGKDLGLKNEPQVQLRFYPLDLARFEGFEGDFENKGKAYFDLLFSKLRPFIDSVFPDEQWKARP